MNINSEWVINYIKNYGTNIIIPSNAEVIEQGSFDYSSLDMEFGEGYTENHNLTLNFENGSHLRKIETFAFVCVKISNEILIPDSVEEMGQFAFLSEIYKLKFGDDSQIKSLGDSSCMTFPNEITIPQNLESIIISENNNTKKLIVKDNSKVNSIEIIKDGVDVILPNGLVINGNEDRKLFKVSKCGDNWKIFYKKEGTYFFELIDGKKSKLTVLESKTLLNVWNPSDSQYNNGIYLYKSIYDLDVNSLLNDERVMFETDCLSTDENALEDNGGRNHGFMYTKQEVIDIRKVLDKIADKVNVPPENVRDREKIIYAQIVQNLFEYLKYDYGTLRLIEQNEFDYDKDIQEQVHSSQNMKGILKGSTVCKGFSTVINSLVYRFGIESKSLSNNEHAWNYVILDGKRYEDDFTWYGDNLAVSNIMGIDTFLGGKSTNGKRKFSKLKFHEISEDIELDDSITPAQQLNLLATDWTKVKDWENVDLNSSKISDTMMKCLFNFASNHRFLASFLLKSKEKNSEINERMLDSGRSVKR